MRSYFWDRCPSKNTCVMQFQIRIFHLTLKIGYIVKKLWSKTSVRITVKKWRFYHAFEQIFRIIVCRTKNADIIEFLLENKLIFAEIVNEVHSTSVILPWFQRKSVFFQYKSNDVCINCAGKDYMKKLLKSVIRTRYTRCPQGNNKLIVFLMFALLHRQLWIPYTAWFHLNFDPLQRKVHT